MMSNEFEQALDAFLEGAEADDAHQALYARDNFENCWKQYHSLGVNGVMDDLHRKFLELSTDPPEE